MRALLTRLAAVIALGLLLAAPGAALNGSEANIEGVDYTTPATNGGDTYEFFVSIYDDQQNDTKYADWWQLETLDGDLLGRQELADNHSDRFQVSASFSLPGRPDYVVIRAHDSTYGYGGQASIIEFDADQERIEQGPEPDDFSDYAAGDDGGDGAGGGGSGGEEGAAGGGGGAFGGGNDTGNTTAPDGNGTDAAGDGDDGGLTVGTGAGAVWGGLILPPVEAISRTVSDRPQLSIAALIAVTLTAAGLIYWLRRRQD